MGSSLGSYRIERLLGRGLDGVCVQGDDTWAWTGIVR